MDIMMPRLQQQASPAPWLVRRNSVDVPRLIRAALEQNPGATVDEVVAQLARWNVRLSGIIVAMWFIKWNESSVVVSEDGGNLSLVKERNKNPLPQSGEPQWASTIKTLADVIATAGRAFKGYAQRDSTALGTQGL